MMRRRVMKGALLASMLFAATAVAACGGDEGSDQGAGTADSAAVQEACDAAEAATQPSEFEPPGPPVDGSVLRGKSIWLVANVIVETTQTTVAGLRESAESLGADVTVFDGQVDVQTYNAGVAQAVAQNADVIILAAVPPDVVEGELVAAKENDIIVIDWLNGQPDAPTTDFVDAHVSMDYAGAAELRVDRAICELDGDVSALTLTSDEQAPSRVMEEAMQEEMERLCPDSCSLEAASIPVADWQSGIPTETNNALTGDPDLNYILPMFGQMSTLAMPQVLAQNALDRVSVDALNLESGNRPLLERGQLIADTGVSNRWLGWMLTDQSIRLLSGEEPVIEAAPIRQVTDDMVQEGGFEDEEAVFGSPYVEGFRELWQGQ